MPLFEGLRVQLSPVGSSVDLLETLEELGIPYALNSVFSLIACYHHLCDRVTFEI